MDRLFSEGGPVLEQLSHPNESPGKDATTLLTFVQGEYEDEDGDWATAFIIADLPPHTTVFCSSCHAKSVGNGNTIASKHIRFSHDDRLSQVGEDGGFSNGSSENYSEYSAGATSNTKCSADWHSTFSNCSKDPECSQSYGLHGTCRCTCGSDGPEFEPAQIKGSGIRFHYRHNMTKEQGEGCNRKRQLDYRCAYDKSNETEEALFFCKLCNKKLPLKLYYTMLSCPCLICIPCCRTHVETLLINATKKAGQIEVSEQLCKEERNNSNGKIIGIAEVVRQTCSDTALVTELAGKNFCLGTPEKITRTGANGEKLVRGEVLPAAESLSQVMDTISCPSESCSGRLLLSGAQILAPGAFKKWEEAVSKDLMEKSTSFMKCPGCHVIIEKVVAELPPGVALCGVPEIDRTAPFIEFDAEGKQLSRSALCHKAANLFRCALCSVNFCGLCLSVPYHLGKTCDQFEDEKTLVKCIYCEGPVVYQRVENNILSPGSVRELRAELEKEEVDSMWCVEKSELLAVQRFASTVCSNKECRKLMRTACTHNLECGHQCGGVRGERHCLPCLKDGCLQKLTMRTGGNFLPSADDLCSICLVDPLRRAPSIQLKCGHVVHLHCARRKLEEGFPGPEISFGYLNCTQCAAHMQHISLDWYMQKPLALMDQVKEKALRRLKLEGFSKSAKEVMPGGRFEAKPAEYALQLYQYYMCCKCNSPYFGGLRDCRANQRLQSGDYSPGDLVCGGCSAGQGLCRKGHGKEYVEFKCKYCCSLATFLCFGNTHFCESCHATRPDAQSNFVPVQCKSPKWCPLGIVHAPNGQECCLGCSMCRLQDQ